MKLSKEQKETLDIRSLCALCEHASPTIHEDEMLCTYNGVVSSDGCCRKFRYDLLKRKPARKPSVLPPCEPLPSLDDDD